VGCGVVEISGAGSVQRVANATFEGALRLVSESLLPLLRPLQVFPSAISDFLVMGRFATPALRKLQLDARRSVSSSTLLARLKAVARVNVCDALRDLKLPTLYLRATEDRLVPRSAGQLYLRYAQAGRVVDLEGPHFLLQARPEPAAEAIRAFLGEVA
jgi:pimeloyl-ACP methyl ester carboxylesterase